MRNDVTKEVMKGFNSYSKPTPVNTKPAKRKTIQKDENIEAEKKENEPKNALSEEKKYLSDNQIKNLPDNLKAGIIKRKKAQEAQNGKAEI
jgi:hypothetical protein